MKRYIKCGKLFTAAEDNAKADQTLVAEDGRITFIGPSD